MWSTEDIPRSPQWQYFWHLLLLLKKMIKKRKSQVQKLELILGYDNMNCLHGFPMYPRSPFWPRTKSVFPASLLHRTQKPTLEPLGVSLVTNTTTKMGVKCEEILKTVSEQVLTICPFKDSKCSGWHQPNTLLTGHLPPSPCSPMYPLDYDSFFSDSLQELCHLNSWNCLCSPQGEMQTWCIIRKSRRLCSLENHLMSSITSALATICPLTPTKKITMIHR